MTAAVLLNRLAHCLGSDLCTQFVIPEVLSLAEDPVFRVRKATALNMESVCSIGSEYELFERLMPAFVRLSKDEMYRVRRACADSLATISSTLSKDLREGVMIEIFLRLSQDPSKLVRQSVLLQAGKFISTLSSRAVNDYILGIFISLADSPTGDASIDNELKHECAFSFPAVLMTVGFDRWSSLRELYRELARCRSIAVKRTLALSFHEVAKILKNSSPDGVKAVEEELAPHFEYMIQDVEAVQVGVLKNLALFFSHLSEPTLLNYLPVLHDLVHTTNPFNWRLRELLALQLSDLVLLPPPHEIYSTLFALAMSLLQDPVAAVRRQSLKGVVTIVLQLCKLENENRSAQCPMPIDDEQVLMVNVSECLETVALAINSLAIFETCQHRLLWLQLSHQLLREAPKEVFEKYFVEGLLKLTTDNVANVRIALSEVLSGWDLDQPPWDPNSDSPWVWLLKRRDIRLCVLRLSKDIQDVYNNVKKLKPLFPDIEFSCMKKNGRGEPPGGMVPVELDEDENQFLTQHFSWEAVKSHFDDVNSCHLSMDQDSNAKEYSLRDDPVFYPKQRGPVNPLAVAMLFVKNIRDKMNSRRNSFREELLASKKEMEEKMAQNLFTTPAMDPEIKEGENLVAKMLSKEVTHSVLPASLPSNSDDKQH